MDIPTIHLQVHACRAGASSPLLSSAWSTLIGWWQLKYVNITAAYYPSAYNSCHIHLQMTKEEREGMSNFAQGHTVNDDLNLRRFNCQTMSSLWGVESLSPSLAQPHDLGQGTASLRGEQWKWFFWLPYLSRHPKMPRQGNFPCLLFRANSQVQRSILGQRSNSTC